MNNDYIKDKSDLSIEETNKKEFKEISKQWLEKATVNKYVYNFSWLGRPIIQLPQDMFAMQSLIFNIKPDLIIETGIAHGGSLIFYSSILELIGKGEVLGIDIEIREHNRVEIEKHPMYKRITMFEGSSIDKKLFDKVLTFSKNFNNIMVSLDSNHSHEHVLNELNLYSQLVKKGSYLIVFDTAIDDVSDSVQWNNRPWGKNNNPKTALFEFLKTNKRFEIDETISDNLMLTVAPSGYLKCISD